MNEIAHAFCCSAFDSTNKLLKTLFDALLLKIFSADREKLPR
jgi:hypothetical protein